MSSTHWKMSMNVGFHLFDDWPRCLTTQTVAACDSARPLGLLWPWKISLGIRSPSFLEAVLGGNAINLSTHLFTGWAIKKTLASFGIVDLGVSQGRGFPGYAGHLSFKNISKQGRQWPALGGVTQGLGRCQFEHGISKQWGKELLFIKWCIIVKYLGKIQSLMIHSLHLQNKSDLFQLKKMHKA